MLLCVFKFIPKAPRDHGRQGIRSMRKSDMLLLHMPYIGASRAGTKMKGLHNERIGRGLVMACVYV